MVDRGTTNQARAKRKFLFRQAAGLWNPSTRNSSADFVGPQRLHYRVWTLLADIKANLSLGGNIFTMAANAQEMDAERPMLVVWPLENRSRLVSPAELPFIVVTADNPIVVVTQRMVDAPIESIDF